MKELDEEK
jgi:hypothetical protein